jgi:7,8-dihydroneopterin aldolase/epimerase/oxygenase
LATYKQTCSDEWIEINDLEVKGRIGVPENERKTPQTLLISVRFKIKTAFAALGDKIERTVDYAGVAAEIERVVTTSRAHLIEKLVSDLGEVLMARFPMLRLEVELRKFILPNARYVSVKSGWTRVRRNGVSYSISTVHGSKQRKFEQKQAKEQRIAVQSETLHLP